MKSSCQCAAGSNWDPNSATCFRSPARFTWDPNSAACLCTSPKTMAEACGTLQCAGNVPDGCGGTIACPANCSRAERSAALPTAVSAAPHPFWGRICRTSAHPSAPHARSDTVARQAKARPTVSACLIPDRGWQPLLRPSGTRERRMPAAGTTLSDAINMHPKDDGGGMWYIAVRRKRVRWMWRRRSLARRAVRAERSATLAQTCCTPKTTARHVAHRSAPETCPMGVEARSLAPRTARAERCATLAPKPACRLIRARRVVDLRDVLWFPRASATTNRASPLFVCKNRQNLILRIKSAREIVPGYSPRFLNAHPATTAYIRFPVIGRFRPNQGNFSFPLIVTASVRDQTPSSRERRDCCSAAKRALLATTPIEEATKVLLGVFACAKILFSAPTAKSAKGSIRPVRQAVPV